MASEVYEHKPTDADRGLDRTTTKQETSCEQLRSLLSRTLDEIREIDRRIQAYQEEIRTLQSGAPRRCGVITDGRRIRVPCAPREEVIADRRRQIEELQRARAEISANLLQIRVAMEEACGRPRPRQPAVSSLPGPTAPSQATKRPA